MARALQDEGFQRTAGKLDPGTRSLLTAFLKMALPRLVRVRRPRDLRRWTKDAVVLAATHSYLVPAIDGLMESAARGALPIGGRVPSHLSATVTGVAGPVAANLAELQVLAATVFSGPGGAPVAAVSAPTAAAIGVAAQMAELYAQTSVAAKILARHGITDPVALRTVMAQALVPGGSELAVRVASRLATRMITRLAASFVRSGGITCMTRKQNNTAWYDPCQEFWQHENDGDPDRTYWASPMWGTGKSKSVWVLNRLEVSSRRKPGTAHQDWVDWDPGADGKQNC